MIYTDYQHVDGFETALRGMRNPLESWNQSDSHFIIEGDSLWQDVLGDVRDAWMEYYGYHELIQSDSTNDNLQWLHKSNEVEDWLWKNSLLDSDGTYTIHAYIGPKDMELAQRLIRAGSDEAKFMRQIYVSVDITAPLYWWKEMDTYKIGTTANSTSTMHKLASRKIAIDDFSFDKELDNLILNNPKEYEYPFEFFEAIDDIILYCESLRKKYIETKDKRYWRALIQLLPESYNQTRTWTANYAVLRNIYFARRNHKLDEWRDFCKWIESLPFAKELICLEEKKGK